MLASRLAATVAYFPAEAVHYFEANNPTSMAEGMVQLYQNAAHRQNLVTHAYTLYEQYQWDKQKQIYLGVFSHQMTTQTGDNDDSGTTV